MCSTDPERLRGRLRGVEAVLFDFDGPLCPLFKANPADGIAERMKELLGEEFSHGPLRWHTDTHALLRDAEVAGVPRPLRNRLETLLAQEEVRAAELAPATEGALDLIRLLDRARRPLAITTNNSPASVRVYLKKQGLETYFGENIFGRDPKRPGVMKPHAECVERALAALNREGESARDGCLMIGDSANDVQAANSARVRFLGFVPDWDDGTRRERKERELREAGADVLVRAMKEVVEGFRAVGLLWPEVR
jgi:beta-phosphoglucomutase-like phosphatase (HAD superfamily)